MKKSTHSASSEPATESGFEHFTDSVIDKAWVRNLAFGGAAVAAIATAASQLYKEFYEEIRGLEPFKTKRLERDEAISGIIQGKMSNQNCDAPDVARKIAQETRDAIFVKKKEYGEFVSDGLRHMGVPKNPLKGLIERSRYLGVYDVSNIVMKTGATLAVAIGGYYLVAQNLRQRTNNKVQDENLRELSRRIDAMEQRREEQYSQLSR